MRLDVTFDGRVPGNINAQPLYGRPAGAASGLVIVANEDNVVTALDAVTGSTVWQRSLGAAAMGAAQPCGNIHPLGITGTPVIDEHNGALYLDAVVDRDGGPRHLVFGLSLADGVVLPGWPVDVADSLRADNMSFDPRAQNQRGALIIIVGDRLYLPYSGLYAGGCGGEYHGWVVGLRLDRRRRSGPGGPRPAGEASGPQAGSPMTAEIYSSQPALNSATATGAAKRP
jgi:outer membrane protein assembly factor BamB